MKLFLKIKQAASIIMIIALVLSCNDKNDSQPSKTPLLVNKSWTIVKYEENGVPGNREVCETDDTTTFFSDGTYVDDIGNTPCDEFDSNTEGSWTFKSNEKIISITAPGEGTADWNIQQLTTDTFVISQYVELLKAEVVVTMKAN